MRSQIGLSVLLSASSSWGLDNGLVRVPWMGWSAWEVFGATTPAQNANYSLSDRLIRQTTDALVDGGFAEAGYRIVWVDDAWMLPTRDNITGALVPDPARWPYGIKATIDYVHSKGLLFGLYGDIGTHTCAGYPGLQRPSGSFDEDAQQLASWGVDAFKVDGCNADVQDMHNTYPALGAALNRTGRPIIYSCSWPDYERASSVPVDFNKLARHCNSWRIFWDNQPRSSCISGVLEFFGTGSTRAAAKFSDDCPGDWRPPSQEPAALNLSAMISAAAPGSFNDADMLQIGLRYQVNDRTGEVMPVKALTLPQAYSAMALWTVLASPLMIAADVRTMDANSRAVWLNKGLVAANQDPLGKQGERVRGNASACQVWKRELEHGDLLIVLYNNGHCPVKPNNGTGAMTVSWKEVGVEGYADTVELIENKSLGATTGVSVYLQPGGSAAYRLKPVTTQLHKS